MYKPTVLLCFNVYVLFHTLFIHLPIFFTKIMKNTDTQTQAHTDKSLSVYR